MSQNVYDDESFFVAYGELPRQRLGLAGAPEWPRLRAMLPTSLAGRRVLDLGCGYGWLSRWAEAEGADEVIAVDGSQRMLDRADDFDDDGRIRYQLADLDTFEPPGRFDVVVSSLALHYVVDAERLVTSLAAAMPAGAGFAFSCEHPIYLAPRRPRFEQRDDGPVWPLDGYGREGVRRVDWLGASGVVKYHRTIETWFTTLRSAGFEVTDLVEWAPTPSEAAAQPELSAELDRPMLLLMGATRR